MNVDTPQVSIVVAAYNVEREIRDLVESLCRSKFKDFELCICDDASFDRTVPVLREYSERLPLRLVVNSSNRGVSVARNRAWAMAKGTLLLFLDADVRIYPDTIGKLLARMERSGADAVMGIYSDVALDRDVFSRFYAVFSHHAFLAGDDSVPYNVFNGWCALCKRSMIERLGGHKPIPKGVEVENESLGRRIVAAGYRLVLDKEIAIDHYWGGLPKLIFISTQRVYWWVKLFFADGHRFEHAKTTRAYGLGTLCLPAAVAFAISAPRYPALGAVSGALAIGFFSAYVPFYRFVRRRSGLPAALGCVLITSFFAFTIGLSAIYSAAEEMLRRLAQGRYTLNRRLFEA